MIIGIVGSLGAGKTLCLSYLAIQDFLKGRQIYSNYPLKFEHTFMESSEAILNNELNRKSTLLLDEVHLWLDSREFQSKKNKVMSRFLLNSRRKQFNVYYTAQFDTLVDRRLRKITDIWIYPNLYSPFRMDNGELGFKWCKFQVVNPASASIVLTKVFETAKVHKYYDSYQNLDYLNKIELKQADTPEKQIILGRKIANQNYNIKMMEKFYLKDFYDEMDKKHPGCKSKVKIS